MTLAAADEKQIQGIGKPAGSALRLHRLLQRQPIVSIAAASKELQLTTPTITAAVGRLEKMGIVREATGRKYGRVYTYEKYLKMLNEGTELQ